MSDKDKPANPFGRVERTIIRPNPGGRLPQAPEAYPTPGGQGVAPPRAAYSPTPASASPASAYSPQGAGYVPSPATQPQGAVYVPAPITPSQEDWVSTPKAAP